MCSLLRLCRGPSDAEPVDRVSRAAPSISHFNERAGIRIPMFCVIIIRVFQLMLSFHCHLRVCMRMFFLQNTNYCLLL